MIRSKYSLITKTADIPMEDLLDIANSVWGYLEQKFGIKRHKKKLDVSLVKGETPQKYMGEYFPRSVKIVVYTEYNKYLRDLIKTIIHEYTHYLQPILKSYQSIFKRVGYDAHPFEIEARYNEQTYYRACWKDVKLNLNYITISK